mgnify:CR=1 FL=1
MTEILIKNGFVATMDRQKTVYRRGSVYIKDSQIVEIGEGVDAPPNPEMVIDAEHNVVLRYDETGDYLQSELRLTSNTDGPLSWYAGVSMYEENIDYHVTSAVEEEVVCNYYSYFYTQAFYEEYYGYPNSGMRMSCSEYFDYIQYYWDTYYPTYGIVVGPFVPTANGMMTEDTFVTGKYTGWAAYADLSYAISDAWDVSLGVRYTYDKKKFTRATPKPESTLLSYYLPGFMNEPITNTATATSAEVTTPKMATATSTVRAPVLRLTRLTRDTNGRAFEYFRSHYRDDAFEMKTTLSLGGA